MEDLGKFRLSHSEALSEGFHARYSAHLRELLGSERLCIWVGPRRGGDLIIRHCIEPSPVSVAPGQGLTTFHGYPRSSSLAHVVWPSTLATTFRSSKQLGSYSLLLSQDMRISRRPGQRDAGPAGESLGAAAEDACAQ